MTLHPNSIIRRIKHKVFNNPPVSVYLTLQDVYDAKEFVEDLYFTICTENESSYCYDAQESGFIDENERWWTVNGPFEFFKNNTSYAGFVLSHNFMLHFSDDLLDLHEKIQWLSLQHNGIILDQSTTNYTLLLQPNIHS
jgi:hypothetical protein